MNIDCENDVGYMTMMHHGNHRDNPRHTGWSFQKLADVKNRGIANPYLQKRLHSQRHTNLHRNLLQHIHAHQCNIDPVWHSTCLAQVAQNDRCNAQVAQRLQVGYSNR
jgi:hypothetical protein